MAFRQGIEKGSFYRGPRQFARDAAFYTFNILNWEYLEVETQKYTVNIRAIFGSTHSEVLTISFENAGEVIVESRSNAQLFDWGKNKSNVRQFLAHFRGHLVRSEKTLSEEPKYLDENENTPVERLIK